MVSCQIRVPSSLLFLSASGINHIKAALHASSSPGRGHSRSLDYSHSGSDDIYSGDGGEIVSVAAQGSICVQSLRRGVRIPPVQTGPRICTQHSKPHTSSPPPPDTHDSPVHSPACHAEVQRSASGGKGNKRTATLITHSSNRCRAPEPTHTHYSNTRASPPTPPLIFPHPLPGPRG
ncbi:hypothetical protein DPEC_G00088400 [Dallia pectoralis]|uniref:Uncharacterized protein n=1 Tax=Dallia pectoralis TaxID=75939 RepID=A0ACC2H0F4_DALPE|nr:hypothetical protein DPEC_G00088400 [Dallia pectoralis]